MKDLLNKIVACVGSPIYVFEVQGNRARFAVDGGFLLVSADVLESCPDGIVDFKVAREFVRAGLEIPAHAVTGSPGSLDPHPEPSGEPVSADWIQRWLKHLAAHASKDEGRPALNFVSFDAGTARATDGHRALVVPCPSALQGYMPRRIAAGLPGLLKMAPNVQVNGDEIHVVGEGVRFSFRLEKDVGFPLQTFKHLDTDAPDTGHPAPAVKSLAAQSTVAKVLNKKAPRVSLADPSAPDAQGTAGPFINPSYLLDAVKAVGECGQILPDPVDPIKVWGDGAVAVVMPMRP